MVRKRAREADENARKRERDEGVTLHRHRMVAENTRVRLLYFYYDASRVEWIFLLHINVVTNSSNDRRMCRNRNEPVFFLVSCDIS